MHDRFAPCEAASLRTAPPARMRVLASCAPLSPRTQRQPSRCRMRVVRTSYTATAFSLRAPAPCPTLCLRRRSRPSAEPPRRQERTHPFKSPRAHARACSCVCVCVHACLVYVYRPLIWYLPLSCSATVLSAPRQCSYAQTEARSFRGACVCARARVPYFRRRLHVGAVLQEQPHSLHMAVLRGHNERRRSVLPRRRQASVGAAAGEARQGRSYVSHRQQKYKTHPRIHLAHPHLQASTLLQ